MRAIESAAELLGQAALAEALGVGDRLLRKKITAEAPVHDADLRATAAALEARASEAARLAALVCELAG